MHRAGQYAMNSKRLMRRTTLVGEEPVTAAPSNLRLAVEWLSPLNRTYEELGLAGHRGEMLNVVADAYDAQVDVAITSMTKLLEPLMILVMGGIITLVALSIFMPMLQLNNLSGV